LFTIAAAYITTVHTTNFTALLATVEAAYEKSQPSAEISS
jgi:hypothetical protein